jgi:hypothetical protein
MIHLAIPCIVGFLSLKQLARVQCNANCMNRSKSGGKNSTTMKAARFNALIEVLHFDNPCPFNLNLLELFDDECSIR